MAFIVPTRLFLSNYVDNASPEALYTVAEGQTVMVQRVTFVNVSASSATISVWIVPSGSSADDTTLLVDAVSIPAGKSWNCQYLERHNLNASDAVYAQASSANTITAHVSGVILA